jgi:hypothetical protein
MTITAATIHPGIRLTTTAYLGHDDEGLACPGKGTIGIESGTEATLCFEITNVGDTPLTNLTLKDPALGIGLADLQVVSGDPTATLEPGATLVLAHGWTAGRDVRTKTTVSATPVDRDGNPVGDRPAANTATILLNTVDPGGVPGFSDGLKASWRVLTNVAQIAILVAGWMIPFVWLPLLAWFGWRRWSRSRRPQPEPEIVERELVGAGAPAE